MENMNSQTGDFVDMLVEPGVIDFRVGSPGPDISPVDLFKQGLTDATPMLCPSALAYTHGQGFSEFRKALADFLTSQTNTTVSADSLCLTSGNTCGIHLTASGCLNRKKKNIAVVEQPTYYLLEGILAGLGYELVRVPTDKDGLQVELLEGLIQNGLDPTLVVTIPVYHNPTGVVLSNERRKRLITLAQQHNFIIFADEPYTLLTWGTDDGIPTERPTFFASSDTTDSGVVISFGSFSKIFTPGVRLGWAQANPKLLEVLSGHPVLASGGGLNSVMAMFILPLLKDGRLVAYLNKIREIYGQRFRALCKTMKEVLPEVEPAYVPAGGYFVTFKFKDENVNVTQLNQSLISNHKVAVRQGESSGSPLSWMRISIAFHKENEIIEGVKRMAKGWTDWKGKNAQ